MLIGYLANRKGIILAGYFVACAGLLLTLAGSLHSEKRLSHTRSEQRINASISAGDPLARNILTAFGLLNTYRLMFGRLATLEQIRQEGYGFFELTNPYTGLPSANRCDRASPGDYCLQISDPYTFDKVVFYDRDGHEIRNPGLLGLQVSLAKRNRPKFWADFLTSHPSEDRIKAFFLGRLFNTVLWLTLVGRSDDDAGFLRLLSQPPFHRLHDTWTGKTIPFDGSAYGDRVKFTRVSDGVWSITIYLPDGSPGYREDFGLAGSGSDRQPFSAIRIPSSVERE